ncbi:hypothetical protein ACVENB_03945 [Staphylococcus aureus]
MTMYTLHLLVTAWCALSIYTFSADSPYQETLISEVSKLMQIITDPNIGSEQ